MKTVHPVSITRFSITRFRQGLGCSGIHCFTLSTLRFSRVWVRKEGNLVTETGCMSRKPRLWNLKWTTINWERVCREFHEPGFCVTSKCRLKYHAIHIYIYIYVYTHVSLYVYIYIYIYRYTQISQGLGPLLQIELLKTGRTPGLR